jgi:hypothetical protein
MRVHSSHEGDQAKDNEGGRGNLENWRRPGYWHSHVGDRPADCWRRRVQKGNGAGRSQQKKADEDRKSRRCWLHGIGPDQVLITPDAGPFHLRGILGRMEIVGNRDYRKQNQRQRRKCR